MAAISMGAALLLLIGGTAGFLLSASSSSPRQRSNVVANGTQVAMAPNLAEKQAQLNLQVQEAAHKAAAERETANIRRVMANVTQVHVGGASDIDIVLQQLAGISLDGCPPDFCEGFYQLYRSFQGIKLVVEEQNRFNDRFNSPDAMGETFLRGMMGDPLGKANEMTTAQAQLEQHTDQAKKDLLDAITRIAQIAAAHGVN